MIFDFLLHKPGENIDDCIGIWVGLPVGLASNHMDAATFSGESGCFKLFETTISKA